MELRHLDDAALRSEFEKYADINADAGQADRRMSKVCVCTRAYGLSFVLVFRETRQSSLNELGDGEKDYYTCAQIV